MTREDRVEVLKSAKGNKAVEIYKNGKGFFCFFYINIAIGFEPDFQWKKGAGGMSCEFYADLKKARAAAKRYFERYE